MQVFNKNEKVMVLNFIHCHKNKKKLKSKKEKKAASSVQRTELAGLSTFCSRSVIKLKNRHTLFFHGQKEKAQTHQNDRPIRVMHETG